MFRRFKKLFDFTVKISDATSYIVDMVAPALVFILGMLVGGFATVAYTFHHYHVKF